MILVVACVGLAIKIPLNGIAAPGTIIIKGGLKMGADEALVRPASANVDLIAKQTPSPGVNTGSCLHHHGRGGRESKRPTHDGSFFTYYRLSLHTFQIAAEQSAVRASDRSQWNITVLLPRQLLLFRL